VCYTLVRCKEREAFIYLSIYLSAESLFVFNLYSTRLMQRYYRGMASQLPEPPMSPGGGSTLLWTDTLTDDKMNLRRHYWVSG
jgi:hypothetical protein